MSCCGSCGGQDTDLTHEEDKNKETENEQETSQDSEQENNRQ